MNNRELILKSIEIIERDIRSKISLVDLANEMGFSLYYYSRLFKSVTGYSPKSYITARKITESAKAIIETNIRIIDLALEFGFGSSEAFSRAFFRVLNKKPSEVRKERFIDGKLLVKQITKRQLKRYEHAVDKEPKSIMLEEVKLVGIPFYYDLSIKNSLSDQWRVLGENISMIPNVKKPTRFYQMQMASLNQESENIYFYIAVEVHKIESVPIQFTAKTIPAQQYFKFRHRGLSNEVGHTYRYIYEEWLPNTEHKLSGEFDFEYYGDEYLGPYNKDSISEIYIPIEKE